MNNTDGTKLYYSGMPIPLAVTHLCTIVITLFLNVTVIYMNCKRNTQVGNHLIVIKLSVANLLTLIPYTLMAVVLGKGHLWMKIESCEVFDILSSVTVVSTITTHSSIIAEKWLSSYQCGWMYHHCQQQGFVTVFILTVVLKISLWIPTHQVLVFFNAADPTFSMILLDGTLRTLIIASFSSIPLTIQLTMTLLIISSTNAMESLAKHRVHQHLKRVELVVMLGYLLWIFIFLSQIWRLTRSSREEPFYLSENFSYRIVAFTGAMGFYIITFTLLMLCMIVFRVKTNTQLQLTTAEIL